MRPHSALAVGLALFAISPCAMFAQGARIAGRARAIGDSARAVVGAEVTLLPAERESVRDTSGLRRALTETDGSFRFTGLADGLYQLRVRRIGFDVRDMDVRVSGQQDRTLDIAMGIAAQQLGSVVISGRTFEFPLRYAEAYARMSHETGDFFTHEQIDSTHAIDLKSILQRLPGVQANDRGINFQRCQGNPFVKVGGSAAPTSLNPQAQSASPAQAAQVQVYVDGVRASSPGDPDRDAFHILKNISPSAVQLMEVYSGVARIPGRYLADACAVILIWTK